ncbi:hypothetical protein ECANGB1_2068 [Enterospora canceri]|uniref:TAFII55 protein conserved region domain-containing protein n=1 Tax=Enterospora canceri TaxID=1081671 RepID=A0A1Y1SA05_9MICR|nr:hypothetical protein ECANGB1_2068 [Enterospora canceri]
MDLSACKLKKINSTSVELVYKNKVYTGVIERPPTVIESQKIIENKMYKIADISGIVRIFSNKEEMSNRAGEEEVLTPPMRWCRERRFRKYEMRMKKVVEVEKQLAKLLEEDAKAVKVELIHQEEEELDEIAADLEQGFVEKDIAQEEEEKEKTPNEVDKEIEEKEKMIEKTTNVVLKKRFIEELRILKERKKDTN